MFMVAKSAKHVINMFQMEGLTSDGIEWKYMEQIFETQFQKISKYLRL